jgi:hypothetical protein
MDMEGARAVICFGMSAVDAVKWSASQRTGASEGADVTLEEGEVFPRHHEENIDCCRVEQLRAVGRG